MRNLLTKEIKAEIPDFEEEAECDVENLLSKCKEKQKDLIETFDACLSLKPQRKDLIVLYMEIWHPQML